MGNGPQTISEVDGDDESVESSVIMESTDGDKSEDSTMVVDSADGDESVDCESLLPLELVEESMTMAHEDVTMTEECLEKVLAELHDYLQNGWKVLQKQKADDNSAEQEDSDEEEDDDTHSDNERSKGDDDVCGPFLDWKIVLQEVSWRMAKVEILLEKEGAAQEDAWKLAREISEQTTQAIRNSEELHTEEEYITCIEALLAQVGRLLRMIRPVDLDLLLQLLQAGQNAGDTMQDKDVLLFIGTTGSGKTSTIHYLAGSTFKEVVVKGFDHLKILDVAHPALQKAETSSSTRSITRSVLSLDITTENGETLAICDSPGFDDTDGVEIDIANGFGLVKAIHRAKRVKPVLVLSQNGIGDRFGAVSQVIRTISRLVGAGSDGASVDPAPFAYAFTKYEEKYADRLYKQFREKRKELTDAEREDASFSAFVRDIASKTKPVANIVSPLNEGKRTSLLSALSEGEWYEDPATSFSFFVSESSLDKLKVQLQFTTTSIRMALERKDAALVMIRLRQLVEIGDRLPDASVFAKQGLDEVSGFLVRHKESLSGCIEKCIELHGNDSAFNQELASVRDIIEVLIDFRLISEKWMSELSIGYDLCVRSIAALTNDLEGVFSRRGDAAHFVSGLREQKHVAIVALRRMKDIADNFSSLSRVISRPPKLYQECCDALVTGIDTVLKETHERLQSCSDAGKFMPAAFLLALQEDFELFFSLFDALKTYGIDLAGDDHERCICLSKEALDAFVHNVQNKFNVVTVDLSSSHGDLEKMVGVECCQATDVMRVLDFLVDCPTFSSRLPRLDGDIAAQMLHEIESSIVSFVQCLVDKAEANLSSAKEEDDEASLRDVAQFLAKADEMCFFFRSASGQISNQCYDQGKRLAVLGKSLDDHLKALSGKQLTMLQQAKHYLHTIETQDPSPILTDIATAWDEWEIACFQAPKKEKPGMVKRFFSWTGFASSGDSSSRDSDFVGQLKDVKLKIRRGLRRRLEQVCSDLNSVPSILFLVQTVSLKAQGFALISWMLNPPNAGSRTNLTHLYTNAQHQLSRSLDSLTAFDSFRAGNYSALSRALDNLRDDVGKWQQIRQIAQGMATNNGLQGRLRRSLLAFECYSSHCQKLTTRVLSIQSAFGDISFLDEARADSKNEVDRNAFYRDVATSLSSLKGIEVLSGHVTSEVDAAGIWKALLDHLETQIRNIHAHLTNLMSTFPDVEADFQRLYVWRSNFQSIEECFAGVEPKVAGVARRSRDEIDREITLALKRLVSGRAPLRGVPELVCRLLVLKKACIELSCWREGINQAIDELLFSMSKATPNSGQFILDVELELKNVDGTEKAVALQVLSEHKCFEGAMNAVFNSATARQGIEYVIESLRLPVDSQSVLRSMHADFDEQYKCLIEKGLLASKSGTLATCFQQLVDEAKATASDYSVDYHSQLIYLTSRIFAYWSLKSMNSFVSGAMSNKNTVNAAIEYLKKSHAAQIVAIWSLLNFQHHEYQSLENHLVEVLTGEGKSIVLGVTAIILAMTNCDVSCVCYSSYLSSRDYAAFYYMFEHFGVLCSIKYSTVEDACDELFNRGGNTRSLSRDIAWGKKTGRTDSENIEERSQILLIDEVDVFFKKDFYGATYNSVDFLHHRSIEELLKHIWANRHSLNRSSLASSPLASACLELFPKDIQPIISHTFGEMLCGAKGVDSHDYIVSEGKICYKEHDGLTSNCFHGYLTTFAAIKEYESGRLSEKQMKKSLGITLSCGHASYAEIPNAFDAILGVTGTLMSLSQKEKDILSHQYGIEKMTYIPSVYGRNKLLFAGDNPKYMIIADDEANFHLELRNEIDTRRKSDKAGGPLRGVMAFFESKETLKAFYESDHLLDLKSATRVITEEIAPHDKEGAFLQATRSGAITLMIREFGRGTDFKCFDSRMLDGGGVHVIQAFFSTEIAEEIQIKGRTARQGARGSYSMVLNAESLMENMGLAPSDIESMRLKSTYYSFLDSRRSNDYEDMCNRLKGKVTEAERCHYETIDYKNCALKNKRNDAIVYLEKWNGVAFEIPRAVATKASFIAEKRKRIKKLQETERNRRREARSKNALPLLSDEIADEKIEEKFFDSHETPDCTPLMIEDETYYDVIGVSITADLSEIEQAFRKASLACHPDKTSDPIARERFHKLTEAKDVLSCPRRRRDYDADVRRRA